MLPPAHAVGQSAALAAVPKVPEGHGRQAGSSAAAAEAAAVGAGGW